MKKIKQAHASNNASKGQPNKSYDPTPWRYSLIDKDVQRKQNAEYLRLAKWVHAQLVEKGIIKLQEGTA